MKKIDLHIHTVATMSDSPFVFSLNSLKRYVEIARLDAIAVTNHDVFDGDQFRLIQKALPIPVFPGIEINIANGHLLLIGGQDDIEDFDERAKRVSAKIKVIGDSMSVNELLEIYDDLDRYLLIPHYEKSPPIADEALDRLKPHIVAGEVDSPKKFVRLLKDASKLTPVLFSDSRMKEDMPSLPNRQTYIDCGTVTISTLKTCLRDRTKVALSADHGNSLWQVFEDGQMISTGLNVLIGSRSSGKTHTLDRIKNSIESVKYIEQFMLVQQDEAKYEREFKNGVEKQRSLIGENHLSSFKNVVEEVIQIDLTSNAKDVERYIDTLLRSASEIDLRDAYSNAALFNEVEFPVTDTKTLKELIESVRQVIENIEFQAIIEKHISISSLKNLILELILNYWNKTLENEKREFVNSMVRDVKKGLAVMTASIQVSDVDLYNVFLDIKRVERFDQIVEFLKQEAIIHQDTIQGFRVEAKRVPYTGPGEIKLASGTAIAFSKAYNKYGKPYEYLQELLDLKLSQADLYKLFVKISYHVLNKDGFEVSGGERSEFRLLQEISDAQNFDILLIDEPESSFDNVFLKSSVNQILKGISQSMPVVVVTHNSTVGASAGADYLLCTTKEIESGKPVYRIYSGYPTDKTLKSADGREIKNFEMVMNSLEAGTEAYESRRVGYEALKD